MLGICRFSNSNIRHKINSFSKLPSETLSALVSLPHKNELFLKERKVLNFHTSATKKDIDTAVRAIGCGIAGIGTGTAGVGIGIIFGNLIQGTARNPSLKGQLFTFGVMGAAFCEALGLFSFILGIIALYG